jgi:hypothetical protein
VYVKCKKVTFANKYNILLQILTKFLGMVKGLGKMLADKERKQRRTIKNAELEKIEEEEDRRVVLEQKSNVF